MRTTRTKRETLTFAHPFLLKSIGRSLPPGAYDVLTDEELIEGLSFPGLSARCKDVVGARTIAACFLG